MNATKYRFVQKADANGAYWFTQKFTEFDTWDMVTGSLRIDQAAAEKVFEDHVAGVYDAPPVILREATVGVLKRSEPKPDRTLTFEFDGLEIEIPCYVEIEPGDGPLVTLADKSLWRIVGPTAEMDRAIRDNFQEQLDEEYQAEAASRPERDWCPEDDVERGETALHRMMRATP